VGYFTNLPVSFGSDDTIMEKRFIDIEIYDAKSKLSESILPQPNS
jgi:hypothetical protein